MSQSNTGLKETIHSRQTCIIHPLAHSMTHRPYCINPCHCVPVMVLVQWWPNTKSVRSTKVRHRPDVVHSPVLRPVMYRPIVYVLYRQPVHCEPYTCIGLVGYCTHHSQKMSCFKVMFLFKLWHEHFS